jgi:hypothetical protein
LGLYAFRDRVSMRIEGLVSFNHGIMAMILLVTGSREENLIMRLRYGSLNGGSPLWAIGGTSQKIDDRNLIFLNILSFAGSSIFNPCDSDNSDGKSYFR